MRLHCSLCLFAIALLAGCLEPTTESLPPAPTTQSLKLAAPAKVEAEPAPAEPPSTEPVEEPAETPTLNLGDFRPRSMLVVEEHHLTHARLPVVDIHTHFRIRTHESTEFLENYVQLMDRNNIAICVSLDGQLGDEFREHTEYLWTNYPNRFVIFANLDWQGTGDPDDPTTWDCNRPDWPRRMALALAEAKELGVSGLKIFKQFGLGYRNADSSLIEIDDPRFDPIWQACGELGLPILIHTADPAAFFLPIDETNERWEELSRHPDWSFYGDEFPSREELLAARNRVIERHPETIFIGAHFANNAEDLATVGAWLERYPNLYLDFASRIGELGRQPRTAAAFIEKYSDRVLFGTDGPWPEERVHLYWRFLETADEYFPYSERPFPPQGFWQIYGLDLSDEVLAQVYSGNAARIIPHVAEKLERWEGEQVEAGIGDE